MQARLFGSERLALDDASDATVFYPLRSTAPPFGASRDWRVPCRGHGTLYGPSAPKSASDRLFLRHFLTGNFNVCSRNSVRSLVLLSCWEAARNQKQAIANQSFDARRMGREQESRVAATASMGLNVAQPFVQFQTSMLRAFAENIEQAARNYEKSFEAISNIIRKKADAMWVHPEEDGERG
jgi:hypothetical protein